MSALCQKRTLIDQPKMDRDHEQQTAVLPLSNARSILRVLICTVRSWRWRAFSS